MGRGATSPPHSCVCACLFDSGNERSEKHMFRHALRNFSAAPSEDAWPAHYGWWREEWYARAGGDIPAQLHGDAHLCEQNIQ